MLKKVDNAEPLEDLNDAHGRLNVALLGHWIDAVTDYGVRLSQREQIDERYKNMLEGETFKIMKTGKMIQIKSLRLAGLKTLIETKTNTAAPPSNYKTFAVKDIDINVLKTHCDKEVREMLKIAGMQTKPGYFAFLLEIVFELVFMHGSGSDRLGVLFRYVITASARSEKAHVSTFADIKEDLKHRLECWVKQLTAALYAHRMGGSHATKEVAVDMLEIINLIRSHDGKAKPSFWY